MAEIFNFGDYKPRSGAVDVDFIGSAFVAEGRPATLSVRRTVPFDRLMDTIAEARENGGLPVTPQAGDEALWFLPWPPAAIRITKSAGEVVPSKPEETGERE